MREKNFRVLVTKEQLTFSSAHFITFGDNICESLHGHNYGVRCEISGALNEHGYVADFIAVRDNLTKIARALDHHVLLPTQHPTIQVSSDQKEVTVVFEQKRWIFPMEDCCLLPIQNTTAELLASYIVDQMMAVVDQWGHPGINHICIGVDENQGQWGECEFQIRRNGPSSELQR